MFYGLIVRLFEKIPAVFLATAWGKNNKEDNDITREVVRVGGKGWFSVDCACFRFDRLLTSASVGEHRTVNRVTTVSAGELFFRGLSKTALSSQIIAAPARVKTSVKFVQSDKLFVSFGFTRKKESNIITT